MPRIAQESSIYLQFIIIIITILLKQGRPQDLAGGGGPRIFFLQISIGNLHVAKPCALLGGFGGMFPREIFFKMVRFGVYFDQSLSLSLK